MIILPFLFLHPLFYVVTRGAYVHDKGIGKYGTDWMYFPDGDGAPRIINLQPSDSEAPTISNRKKRDVEFRLYTKWNLGEYIVLNNIQSMNDLEIKDLLSSATIKIITHGWMATASKGGVMDLVNAYLFSQNEVNVIAVDWSSYSMNYLYMFVANETKEVGRIIAQFLNALHDKFNVSGNQIHLIGHSLGAHVMGIAGYESKMKIGRITGLDPALPMFKSIQKEKSRLDYGDAIFVDVIHTCGGVLGFWDAIGQADFYPNNGKAPQPGCTGLNVFHFEACSHGRSINYFSESILNPNAFPSYECNGWNQNIEQNCPFVGYMGENANWNMSGIFYLKTNSEEPFGRGQQYNR